LLVGFDLRHRHFIFDDVAGEAAGLGAGVIEAIGQIEGTYDTSRLDHARGRGASSLRGSGLISCATTIAGITNSFTTMRDPHGIPISQVSYCPERLRGIAFRASNLLRDKPFGFLSRHSSAKISQVLPADRLAPPSAAGVPLLPELHGRWPET
jgi:hypothetical protein